MQLMPKQKQYALVLVEGIACQSYPAFVHIMQATIMMHALQAEDYIGYVKEIGRDACARGGKCTSHLYMHGHCCICKQNKK